MGGPNYRERGWLGQVVLLHQSHAKERECFQVSARPFLFVSASDNEMKKDTLGESYKVDTRHKKAQIKRARTKSNPPRTIVTAFFTMDSALNLHINPYR